MTEDAKKRRRGKGAARAAPRKKSGRKAAGRTKAAGAGVAGKGRRKPQEAPRRFRGPKRIYAFADTLAQEEAGRAPEEPTEPWVTFGLGDEDFALPVTHVQEILRVQQITRVPHAPEPVRGITNVRGRVIPVVDLRRRLHLPPGDLTGASRILVADSRGRLIGFLVDSVVEVARLRRSRFKQPPEDVLTEQSDYILAVYELGRDDLLILLDADRVLLLDDWRPAARGRKGEVRPGS